jgi:hypothetical protein
MPDTYFSLPLRSFILNDFVIERIDYCTPPAELALTGCGAGLALGAFGFLKTLSLISSFDSMLR